MIWHGFKYEIVTGMLIGYPEFGIEADSLVPVHRRLNHGNYQWEWIELPLETVANGVSNRGGSDE